MIDNVGVHAPCFCCDSPILALHNPLKPNKRTPCLHCYKLARTQDFNGCRFALDLNRPRLQDTLKLNYYNY